MSPRKSKRPPVPPAPEPAAIVREGFSTWRTPNPALAYDLHLAEGPGVWNGSVNVHRYRFTVERIDEPREVILARMVDLWRSSTNHHVHTALEGEARRLGATMHELLNPTEKR